MIKVEVARSIDLEAFIGSVAGLFEEDAGQRDEYSDPTWPSREGLDYYQPMVEDPDCLLLVARDDETVLGHLVGLVSEPTPTRLDVRFATLQSIWVKPDVRSTGIGQMLTERFFAWGRDHGCVQAVVTAYVDNVDAQRFYQRHGFAEKSLTSVCDLRQGRAVVR